VNDSQPVLLPTPSDFTDKVVSAVHHLKKGRGDHHKTLYTKNIWSRRGGGTEDGGTSQRASEQNGLSPTLQSDSNMVGGGYPEKGKSLQRPWRQGAEQQSAGYAKGEISLLRYFEHAWPRGETEGDACLLRGSPLR